MKLKHFIIIGLLFGVALIPSTAQTWGVVGLSGGGGECTTALWTNSGAGTTDLDINDSVYYQYVGQIINDASTHTFCKVDTWISFKAGDISGKTFRAYFAPVGAGSSLTLGSAVEADSAVSGSNSWDNATNSTGTKITWEFSGGYTCTGNNTYAFYITMDGSADASNYAELELGDGSDVIPGGGSARWDSAGNNRASGGVDIKTILYQE